VRVGVGFYWVLLGGVGREVVVVVGGEGGVGFLKLGTKIESIESCMKKKDMRRRVILKTRGPWSK